MTWKLLVDNSKDFFHRSFVVDWKILDFKPSLPPTFLSAWQPCGKLCETRYDDGIMVYMRMIDTWHTWCLQGWPVARGAGFQDSCRSMSAGLYAEVCFCSMVSRTWLSKLGHGKLTHFTFTHLSKLIGKPWIMWSVTCLSILLQMWNANIQYYFQKILSTFNMFIV